MKKTKKRKRQQDCKLMQAMETAIRIFKAVEPIVKTLLANGRKTK
jgi:hypothetical protein